MPFFIRWGVLKIIKIKRNEAHIILWSEVSQAPARASVTKGFSGRAVVVQGGEAASGLPGGGRPVSASPARPGGGSVCKRSVGPQGPSLGGTRLELAGVSASDQVVYV